MGKEETEEVMVPEKEEKGGGEEATSVERVFEGQRLPGWREQLTVRAFVVSFFLAVMFSVIVMKLNLTTGIIPSLNVAAGLLGFFFVKLWTKGLESTGLLRTPFTRQENTVIQTCVVAAYGLAFSGMATTPHIMIIDYKLIYPSGTATAYLINGFHTPQGEKLAK
ncbi:hypothetical protein BHE74_00030290 [Ensete ventricosum]|nr:hypothetical protein BHE74_00030290 [Ensete ventricosum]